MRDSRRRWWLFAGLWLLVGVLGCGADASDDPAGPSGSGAAGAALGGGGEAPGGGGVGGAGGAYGGGGVGGAGGSVAFGGAGGASVPLPGFGDIAGSCGVLEPAQLQSPDPSVLANSIDFDSLTYDYDLLSTGGQEVYDDGNLGGSSIYSEVFSYELLYRCELATLLKTEAEVTYLDPQGKKTDLLVDIDGLKIGVSVTRAYKYPPGSPYTVADAKALLEGKLADILLSTVNVDPQDAWAKQILHVIAYADEHANSIAQALPLIDAATKADTIVIVTVTDGDDAFLY